MTVFEPRDIDVLSFDPPVPHRIDPFRPEDDHLWPFSRDELVFKSVRVPDYQVRDVGSEVQFRRGAHFLCSGSKL